MEIQSFFSFSEGINYLTNLISPHIQSESNNGRPIPPRIQILTTLRYLGSASLQLSVADTLNLSQPTVSLCIRRVCEALVNRVDDFIKWPSDVVAVQSSFSAIASFPRVVGALDGTHVRIRQPKLNPNAFINRKYYPSINVCAVADPHFKFTFASIRWPGSCHDSFVLRQTSMWNAFEDRSRQGIILGDSAYPCRQWLMTPFPTPRNRSEEAFNLAHKKTRAIIECAFGMLKKRFRILHDEMRVDPEKAPLLILAAMILHNIALDMRMPDFDEETLTSTVAVPSDPAPSRAQENGMAMRQHIADAFFS